MSSARAATASPSAFGAGFRLHELFIALAVVLVIEGGSALALRAAALHRQAETREIDPGIAVPIQVTPVLDVESPLLKLGGKKVRYKLPDRWVRQAPQKRVERRAFASTKADKSAEAAVPPEVKMADAGTDPPDPDAAVAKEVDQEITEETDAGPANVDEEGHADGVPEGTETDPLKARAANLYHSRILAFLTAPFRSRCSGLDPKDFEACQPSASVQLGADGTVVGYSFNPCGTASVDGAARAALGNIQGQSIPPPPENYPNLRPNSFHVTYVCR